MFNNPESTGNDYGSLRKALPCRALTRVTLTRLYGASYKHLPKDALQNETFLKAYDQKVWKA